MTRNITATEVGRNLEIVASGETFIVPPVPARIGAGLQMQLMAISFGTFELSEEEQSNLFETAMGSELFNHCMDTLRLDQMTPVSTIALYWNTVGMEAVEAYIAGGVGKALEVILSRNGLLPQTSPNSVADALTSAPAFMKSTATQSGGETK